MFGAMTQRIFPPSSRTAASSSGLNPVVAITIALSASTTCRRCCSVAAGCENSITTSPLQSTPSSSPVIGTPSSPMPATTPTSLPICGCAGYSIAPTTSISVCWATPWVMSRPMRPHAPLTMTPIISVFSKSVFLSNGRRTNPASTL